MVYIRNIRLNYQSEIRIFGASEDEREREMPLRIGRIGNGNALSDERRIAMTATHCPETAIREPLPLNLISSVVAKTAALLRAVRNRRELYHLGQMNDIELADIGLRRGDLFEAVETPFHADATGRLNTIVSGRSAEEIARRSF
jgi:uncharacterized protein YjiS (DUF1127 family)